MWRLLVLVAAFALMLAVHTQLAALGFFAVVLGLFVHIVFRSTADRGPTL